MKLYLKCFALLLLLTIYNCSKDNNDNEVIEEVTEVIISSNETSLKDAQLATITVENYTLTKETYNAKFGEQDIILGKINNSSLTFLVPPNITSGKYNLAIDIASNTIEFDITKTELTEAPENVFSNFVGDYQNEIDQTIALFEQGNTPPQLLLAKDQIDKAITDLNNLSENDKIIAAKFIEYNTSDLKELENILNEQNIKYAGKSVMKNCNTPNCYFAYGTKVLLAVALLKVGSIGAFIGAIVVGVDAIVSLIEGKQNVLLSNAKKVAQEALNITIFWRNKVLDIVFDEANNSVFNKTVNRNSNTIDNNTTIKFNIKPTKRTLNQEDQNSSNDIVKNLVIAYFKCKSFWNEHFKSKLGEFPSFNDNETQEFADELSQFLLAISNNSENVSVSNISGSVEEFTATFTNNTDTEQDFTLDVVFKEGDAEQKTSIDFTINNGIFGTWNISITDTCTDSQGNVSNPETYNGQIILNEDYTVTYVGQDNSNTVSNNFSFTNNTLVIETTYNDFSIITPCNGQDSQLVSDTQTMQYDESNDSFSGTTLTTTPEINGVDENGNSCIIEGRTCNGTVTLTR